MAQPLLLAHIARDLFFLDSTQTSQDGLGSLLENTPGCLGILLEFAEAPCSSAISLTNLWKRRFLWLLVAFVICMHVGTLGLPCCKYCLWVFGCMIELFHLLGELRRMEQLCSHYHIFLESSKHKMLMYQG